MDTDEDDETVYCNSIVYTLYKEAEEPAREVEHMCSIPLGHGFTHKCYCGEEW